MLEHCRNQRTDLISFLTTNLQATRTCTYARRHSLIIGQGRCKTTDSRSSDWSRFFCTSKKVSFNSSCSSRAWRSSKRLNSSCSSWAWSASKCLNSSCSSRAWRSSKRLNSSFSSRAWRSYRQRSALKSWRADRSWTSRIASWSNSSTGRKRRRSHADWSRSRSCKWKRNSCCRPNLNYTKSCTNPVRLCS